MMSDKVPVDLVIEGEPEQLEWLRKKLETLPQANLEPVTSQDTDELREPFLIALIVALGGKTVIKEVRQIIELFLKHREKMAALKFKYVYQDDSEEIIGYDRIKKDAG